MPPEVTDAVLENLSVISSLENGEPAVDHDRALTRDVLGRVGRVYIDGLYMLTEVWVDIDSGVGRD